MAETDCELWEAESVYERFNHNTEKAVKHIFSTSLTISVDSRKDTTERGMGYIISALDADLNSVSKRSIFIPMEDFDEYLLEDFKAVFPLYQPQWDTTENYFNCTTSNVFKILCNAKAVQSCIEQPFLLQRRKNMLKIFCS